jgi:hypothetical protein
MEYPQFEKRESGFDAMVAILIAVVTVIGALVTWRAAVAADTASDTDFAGMKAVVSYHSTVSLSTMNAYENLRNFIEYKRLGDLGNLLEADLTVITDTTEYDRVERQKEEAFYLQEYARIFFPNQYVNKTGEGQFMYDVKRNLGELIADAARTDNLDFQPLFVSADDYRGKSSLLIVAVTILSLGLVILTIIGSVGKNTQKLLLVMAILIALAGSGVALYAEFAL